MYDFLCKTRFFYIKMENSKIIKILKKLSKDEFKLLDKFVLSPVHNRHQDVITLFRYLKKHLTSTKKQLSKEKTFHHLFPNKEFEAQKLHYVNSYLLKVVEEFLAWQEWKNDKVTQQIYLIKAYNKHDLGQPVQKTFEQAVELQEKLPLRNANYYLQKYQLHFGQIKHYKTLGRNVDFNLQEFSELIDKSFIAEKLKSSCAMISHQSVSKKNYDMGLLNGVFEYIEQRNLLKEPAIAIYYYAYKALSDNEDMTNFLELKKQLLANEAKFETAELSDIYLAAINFCIKRWNQGDGEMMAEIFKLYQAGLHVDVFLDNGILSRWSYSNIVLAGLLQKEYNWVEKFINEYVQLLPEKHREGSFNFNLAKYYYEVNNYPKAMALLQKIEYDDLFHTMGAKIILAKMYYELSEMETLDNLIKSAQAFIRRKKVMGYHKEVYLRIFIFLKKLTNINIYDKLALEQLKTEIINTKQFPEKVWLLEQVEKIRNNRLISK